MMDKVFKWSRNIITAKFYNHAQQPCRSALSNNHANQCLAFNEQRLMHFAMFSVLQFDNNTMKIANQNTFQQFDKLKQQIFAHKLQQGKQKKQPKNPFSSKFRYLLPVAVVVGGGWLLYRNLPDFKNYLIQNKVVSYQQYLVFQSLRTELKCKAQQLLQHPRETPRPGFANEIYLTKLASDQLYLKQRMPEKLLDVRTKTRLSFWIFNLGVEETVQLINSYGDLVTRQKQYKFNFGGVGNFWGSTQETIVKRSKLFDYYQSDRENKASRNNCQNVNFFTRLQHSSEQYQKALSACRERQHRISSKIEEFISQRLREEQRRKIKTKNSEL